MLFFAFFFITLHKRSSILMREFSIFFSKDFNNYEK